MSEEALDMLSLTPACRIWLCTHPTDMRRSFDGLAALVRHHLAADPTSGDWYAFINRRRTQIKVLAFEEGGYCVWGRLMPAADSLVAGALPIGLAHGIKLTREVGQGQVLTWNDVALDESNETLKVRREMEAAFAAPTTQAAE